MNYRCLLVVLIAFSTTFCRDSSFAAADEAAGAGENAASEAAAPDAVVFVTQLGADSYQQRTIASQEILALGSAALSALRDGLQSPDLQTRRSCRRLLDVILDADLKKRIEKLAEDGEGVQGCNLPGWKQFREVAGDDQPARQLFASMLRAEPVLFESFASGPDAAREALALRLRHVFSQAHMGMANERHLPSLPSIASILLVASDPSCRLVDGRLISVISLLQRTEFSKDTKEGTANQVLVRLLGHFLLSADDPQLARQCLQLGTALKVKQPTMRLALRVLHSSDQHQPLTVAGAAGILGVLGGRDFCGALPALLEDERVCTIHTRNNVRRSIQVRDVAAAWLVHCTGQNLKDYGLGSAESWFKTVYRSANSCFSVSTVVFSSDDARNTALAKLRTWLDENPLGTVPLEPAPGRSKDAAQVAGQPVPADKNQQENTNSERSSLALADYFVVRQLDRARELVRQRRYSEAVGTLGEILQTDEDLIYKPKRGEQGFRNLKAEAGRIMGTVPSAGLRAYELHFGPLAKRQLGEALDAGDIERLAEVERKYFFSEAGWQAAEMLAVYYRHRGEPYMASVYLQRLRRRNGLDDPERAMLSLELAVCWLSAGRGNAAREQLIAWKRDWPESVVLLGNQKIAVFGDDEDPCQWLERVMGIDGQAAEDWLVPRGDVTGQSTYSGGPIWLDDKTLFSVGDEGYLKSLLKQIDDDLQQRRIAAVPAVQPLVIGRLLVLRTVTGLTAFDRSTGELQWETPAENALVHMLRNANDEQREQLANVVRTGIGRRLRTDIGWGAITSNGKLVFAVEDLGFDLGLSYQRVVTQMDGLRRLDTAANQRENAISAYDASTGKQVWQVGEAFGEVASELKGGRFLGPPLPLGDQLYAVMDFPESTRLALLDAETGSLQRQWVLNVCEVASRAIHNPYLLPAPQSPDRCAPPVLADGVLVCGSRNGKFTAFDVVAGVTLWSYEIETAESPFPLPWKNVARIAQWQSGETDCWAATAATILGPRVLLTRASSDELHCVDLRTGERLWSTWRRDGLYVAGTDENMLLLVGRSGIRALRLADGEPAWEAEMVRFRSGAVPAGRGYVSGHACYVPLSTGEVAVFDVRTGHRRGKVLPAEPIRLGNLVPIHDSVLSAGLSEASSFQLLSGLPQDQFTKTENAQGRANGLANRVRFALAAGRVDEALDWLALSAQTDPTPKTQELLAQTLLLNLQENPSGFADRYTLLDESVLGQPQRTADWLDLAEALIDCGYAEQATELYERLGDAEVPLDEMQVVEAARTLRADRRIAAGLQQLADTEEPADGPIRRRIDTVVSKFPAIANLLGNRRSAREGLQLNASAQERDKATEAALARFWGRPKIDVRKKPAPTLDATDPLRSGQQIPVLLDRVAQLPAPQLSVTYETRTRTLIALDRWGRRCVEIVLPEIKARNMSIINPGIAYFHGVVVGELLVFYRGDIVTAVDCGTDKVKLLWTKETWPPDQDYTAEWQVLQAARQPLRLTRVTCPGTQPRSIAAGPDYVCFQNGRSLTAVDPATGNVLWSRDDLVAGYDLTGDTQRIYATPPYGEQTFIFSALDGRLLDRRPPVKLLDRIGVVDGLPLLCRQDQGRRTCGLYDPWQQEFLWQRDVSADALLAMAGHASVGIVDPGGTVVVLDAGDGREILAAELDPFDKLDDVAFLQSGDVTVLAAHRRDESKQQLSITSRLMPGEKIINGNLYGLREGSGELLWTQPLANQQLRTNQPSGVPLVIACNRFQRLVRMSNKSLRHEPPQLLLTCIDTRNGQIVHETSSKTAYRANYLFATDSADEIATLTTVAEVVEFHPLDK